MLGCWKRQTGDCRRIGWSTYYECGQSNPPSRIFTDISSGWYHTCGIRIDGTVECWGVDNGSSSDYSKVTDTPNGYFVDISAGGNHTCGIKDDGNVKCWG